MIELKPTMPSTWHVTNLSLDDVHEEVRLAAAAEKLSDFQLLVHRLQLLEELGGRLAGDATEIERERVREVTCGRRHYEQRTCL